MGKVSSNLSQSAHSFLSSLSIVSRFRAKRCDKRLIGSIGRLPVLNSNYRILSGKGTCDILSGIESISPTFLGLYIIHEIIPQSIVQCISIRMRTMYIIQSV